MPDEFPNSATRDFLAVGFALLLPSVVTLAYFVLAASFSSGVQQTTYSIAKVFQFVFPIAFVLLVQKKPWPRLNWTPRGVLMGVLFGLAVGGAMLTLYHGDLADAAWFAPAEGAMRAKIAGMNLGSPLVFIAVGVFYSLIHSLLEEYYWRWFVFGELNRLQSFVPAMVISSLGFMAHHVIVIGTYFGFFAPITWAFSLCVAIGGAFWAWLYHRSGSLWGPWLSHMLVDAAIFIMGYDIATATA